MSKLIDNIRAEITGRREAKKRSPLLAVTMATEKMDWKIPALTEYKVYVVFGARFACENQNDVNMAIESIIRLLREEIYCDVKNRLFRLEKAVTEDKRDKILMEMRDIIKEIYG